MVAGGSFRRWLHEGHVKARIISDGTIHGTKVIAADGTELSKALAIS